MENNKETRWKQRFKNFERALRLFESYIAINDPSNIERAGGIQYFEMCFELAWKTMKDYLESEGYEVNSPRSTIKQAFETGLITDGHDWIDILDDRNLMAHIYDDTIAEEVNIKIREKYFPIIEKLYNRLNGEIQCLDC